MTMPDERTLNNRTYGDRDPQRPPGLALVVIALIVLLSLGYAIFPHGAIQPSPGPSGGGAPATNSPSEPSTGK